MLAKAKNKIYSIQILRGIAACAVVMVHHQQYIQLSLDNPFKLVIPGASWGVDLFFLISGFIAAHSVLISDGGLSEGIYYFLNRLIRIIPLYYLITILSFGSDSVAWVKSLKSMLFIPIGGGDGPIYGGAQIGQGWTLNYEMYFYLVVAFSFLFGRLKWAFTMIVIAGLISLATMLTPLPDGYLIYGFRFSSTYISLVTHPIILEFLAGLLLGLHYSRMKETLSTTDVVLCFGGIGVFIYNAIVQRWTGHGLQGWGASCFLLLASVVKLEKGGLYIKNKFLIHLGACSYSIYLLHENIKNIFIKISKHLAASGVGAISNIMFIILSFGTTLILAHYTNKWVEVKLSGWLKTQVAKWRYGKDDNKVLTGG
jgi:peptidoglycan/LPS O-acetylase OafA/YrhL